MCNSKKLRHVYLCMRCTFNLKLLHLLTSLSLPLMLKLLQPRSKPWGPNFTNFTSGSSGGLGRASSSLQNFYNATQPSGVRQFGASHTNTHQTSIPSKTTPLTYSYPQYQARPHLLSTPPPNAMLTNSGLSTSNALFPDSRASFHVTNASQNIQQCMPLEGPDQIFIGSGQEASDILLRGHVGRDDLNEFPHPRFIQSPASSPTSSSLDS
ncbi:hypothetical protein L195_g013567 [Trifolium pratense]|uniref:Uncharacterized protein n=1 Tax=Trifolium pratense TaxID=57577 RepID=A0A2K3PNH9_TRIPR|nr:hypothetical protein L195_g013567 [Trifolium pratense]